jgi:Leucine-rich repeat (LRR) protein
MEITELNLADSNLHIFPSLSERRIKKLNLQINRIRLLWPDLMPQGLQELNLDTNELGDDGLLDAWPDTIHTLRLSNNPLRFLDSVEVWPTALRVLDLSYTNLSGSLPALPNTIETLNICHTYISSIVTLPASLKELIAYTTNLTKVPRQLPEGLRILDLSHASLKNGGLPSRWPAALEEIKLQNNFLTEFPKHFPPALRTLHLSNNRIQALCAEDNFPPALQILGLARNRIQVIPGWVATKRGLTLTISDNCLTVRPDFPGCVDHHRQWYEFHHHRMAERVQRAWRRLRGRRILRIWRRSAALKETLLATAMHPSRAGQFEDISQEWDWAKSQLGTF